MITTGISYFAVIVFWAGLLKFTETRLQWKIFNYLPPIVLLYLSMMIFAGFGLWTITPEIKSTNGTIQDFILPAMIFLMLLKCDIRKIYKLGPKLLIGFFSASISIMLAFMLIFFLFKNAIPADAWKPLSALAGSWIGGTGNLIAVQKALHVSNQSLGPMLITDSINYSIWVMILLMLVPCAKKFNHWTKADTYLIKKIGEDLEHHEKSKPNKKIGFAEIIFLIGTAFLVSIISQKIGGFIGSFGFLGGSVWTIFTATIFGIICAVTPLGEVEGSNELANTLLFIIVGLIASLSTFTSITQAPIYIVMGACIIITHVILMIILAKVFKLDLFTCGVASLANIGGVAAAPILSAAYSEVLIPVGVLMGLLGYVLGTFGGLIVAEVLAKIALM